MIDLQGYSKLRNFFVYKKLMLFLKEINFS